jgi:hypothetical protein
MHVSSFTTANKMEEKEKKQGSSRHDFSMMTHLDIIMDFLTPDGCVIYKMDCQTRKTWHIQ